MGGRETNEEHQGDLHAGFRSAQGDGAGQLGGFLGEVDRLPGIRAIQRAIRAAMALQPTMSVLDVGCGLGFEAQRLAVDNPNVSVCGLDHNAELLRQARLRAERTPLPNLAWRVEDLNAPSGQAVADVVRTERVLMYQDDLETAIDGLLRLLRPGGRIVCFELDYGATLLDAMAIEAADLRHLEQVMRSSLPQPHAGRELPARLAARGLTVTAEPYSFSVTRPVWQRIVGDTLRAHDPHHPGIQRWLAHHEAERAPMPAAFTGVLTVATTFPGETTPAGGAKQDRTNDVRPVLTTSSGAVGTRRPH